MRTSGVEWSGDVLDEHLRGSGTVVTPDGGVLEGGERGGEGRRRRSSNREGVCSLWGVLGGSLMAWATSMRSGLNVIGCSWSEGATLENEQSMFEGGGGWSTSTVAAKAVRKGCLSTTVGR